MQHASWKIRKELLDLVSECEVWAFSRVRPCTRWREERAPGDGSPCVGGIICVDIDISQKCAKNWVHREEVPGS